VGVVVGLLVWVGIVVAVWVGEWVEVALGVPVAVLEEV
jgi:hypothetical protein